MSSHIGAVKAAQSRAPQAARAAVAASARAGAAAKRAALLTEAVVEPPAAVVAAAVVVAAVVPFEAAAVVVAATVVLTTAHAPAPIVRLFWQAPVPPLQMDHQPPSGEPPLGLEAGQAAVAVLALPEVHWMVHVAPAVT